MKARLFLRFLCWVVMSQSLREARGGTANTTRSRAGGPLTLEAAYDRALANDESIGIAYQELLNAGLQPLSVLTRLAPQVTGSASLDLQSALRDLNNSRAQLVSSSSDLEVARRNLARQTAAFEDKRVRQATERAARFGGLLKFISSARQ